MIYSSYDKDSGQWMYFRSDSEPVIEQFAAKGPTPYQVVGIRLPSDAIPIGSGELPKGYAVSSGSPCGASDDTTLRLTVWGVMLFGLQYLFLRK